ncbi:uncharacterized protein [Ambystoma mexicanum]|uniref:uncharacterized protein n=1 Tax=Ambystoma mexicanum TaxID=8296 RepID=UPI0037E91807
MEIKRHTTEITPVPSELTVKHVELTVDLLNINDETDLYTKEKFMEEQNIPLGLAQETKLKEKSKFTPILPPENVIDTFCKVVQKELRDIYINNKMNQHAKLKIRNNLTPNQSQALNNLKNNPEITIKSSDKGGNIVLLNTEDYIHMALTHLKDHKCYEKIKENPFIKISEQWKTMSSHWKDLELLNEDEYRYMITTNPITPTIYFLPKIHKKYINLPTSRPIINGIGSITEHISEYIDHQLQPLANSLASYIRDTTHIIQLIDNIPWNDNYWLVTMDVTALYTSILHEKGLLTTEYFLKTRSISLNDHNNMILEMLQFTLQNNIFIFNNTLYRQIQGTAMGAKYAPSYANLYMGHFEIEFAWQHQSFTHLNNIIFWARYIDDIFLIWNGPLTAFKDYFNYLNHNTYNLKLTTEYSQTSINFLDITFYIDNNTICTTLYTKPTSVNSLLHASSSHPKHIIYNIPYGEILRVKRNCSKTDDFKQKVTSTMSKFISRGYPNKLIKNSYQKSSTRTRQSLLQVRPKIDKTVIDPHRTINFTTNYSSNNSIIRKILSKYWNILKSDSDLTPILEVKPTITFKKASNLKKMLSPSHFELKYPDEKSTIQTMWLQKPIKGYYKCGQCSMCQYAENGKTTVIKPNGTNFTIQQLINCNSQFVIYIIQCACKKLYIGSTIRKLKTRISEHIRAITNRDTRSPIANHFTESHHPSQISQIKFYGIVKLKPAPRGGNLQLRLRQQEARWICMMDTCHTGLNTDQEICHFL